MIDACLRLHNFIIDFRESERTDTVERELFDEDCRRFMAEQSCVGTVNVGVHGGEMDVRRGQDGNPVVGGRPTLKEQAVRSEGLSLRQKLKDFIQRQRCERPSSNWFRKNNRVLDNIT